MNYISLIIWALAFELLRLVYENIEVASTTPSMVLGVIVTILIPFAIFLADKSERAFPFDKELILKRLFKCRWLMALIIASFVALLLNCKILNFMTFVGLVIYFCVTSVCSYRWFCSRNGDNNELTYRQRIRLAYLKSLKGNGKILETWSMLLLNEDFSKLNQTGTINVLLDTLEMLFKNAQDGSEEDRETLDDLTTVLLRSIDKIHFVPREIFEKTVRFSILYFEQILAYDSSNENILTLASQRDLFHKLTKIATTDDDGTKMLRYLLFRALDDFLTRASKKGIDYEKYKTIVLREVFGALRESGFDIYDMWTWDARFWSRFIVVDRKQLKRSLIIAYRELLQEILLYRDVVSNRDGEFLANITNLIFPKVKLTVWFDLLTFFSHWSYAVLDGKSKLYSKIVSWCKTSRTFGLTDGFRRFDNVDAGFYASDKGAMNRIMNARELRNIEDFRETIDLLKAVCGLSFDYESCKNILREINKIKRDHVFGDNSIERARLDELESWIKNIVRWIFEQYNKRHEDGSEDDDEDNNDDDPEGGKDDDGKDQSDDGKNEDDDDSDSDDDNSGKK